MKTRLVLGVCLFALLGVLAIGEPAWGQTTGSIRGTVKDPSGAIVPSAQVTATLAGTATARMVAVQSDGSFEIAELAVGSYEVTIEAAGFKKFVVKALAVDIGRVAVVNATLEVGGSAQTVTVEGESTQVETTSTQLGAVMNDVAVTELPLSTRNTYQLLQLQPGVQSQLGADLFYGSDSPGVVSVNGGRGRSNNYMVNGGDGNDIFVNGPAIQPSPDSIDEFRVLTNTFDAEYGRNSGSVVNVVTKSGTNQIHGDAYEFFRNSVLNTRGYFDPSTPDYKQNQFGATLGGPIKKDKTFIFGSYEGDRLRQGISSGSVLLPTAGEAGGDYTGQTPFFGSLPTVNPSGVTGFDFSSLLASRTTGGSPITCQQAITNGGGGTITPGADFSTLFPNNIIPVACYDPVAFDLYQRYVQPLSASGGTFSATPDRKDRNDQFTIRFDHHITAAQQFSAYYFFNDDDRTDPFSNFQAAGANVAGFGALFKTRTQQWNISHTWTIGSNSVNEFRFNYFREGQGNLNHPVNVLSSISDSCSSALASICFTDPTVPQYGITTNLPGREGVPFISVPGGFAIGNNFEGELPQVGNTFQWTDNYSRVIGKHSIKFGGDVRRAHFDQFLYFDVNGEYSYVNDGSDGIGSDDAYPNYFLGLPNLYLQGAAQGENIRNTALYLFAQDSWKLTNSVTLNYGVRWEFNQPYYDTGNRLQTFRPGQVTTQYPCFLSPQNASNLGVGQDCSPGTDADSVFPLGLVFPGDKGVPRGLTSTYWKAFAPRIGIAWSPNWSDGILGKLAGGPGKMSVRMGFGIFYNPIEQLVLEQFSAEPPFGGSTALSNTLFNLPFLLQDSTPNPNPFGGVIHQTPQTACPFAGGPTGCVDWSSFRPILLFGEFQPHLRTQYSEQYNLTIQREIVKNLIFSIGYVGTQAHHLLASRDLNAGNAQTCLDIITIQGPDACGEFGADSSYFIPANSIPAGVTLHLPYGSVPSVTGPNNPDITLVGLRPFSSPLCQPTTGASCPPDGIPVFSNIFAEDTIANSNYNALQVSLEQNFSHGLLFKAAYTYSKSIDYGSSFESELNPVDFKKSRGLSLYDARHRFVFSPYWELPIPKHDGFTGKLINGWAVSGIVTYQTGFPIRFFTGNDPELASSFFFESAGQPQITGKVQFVHPSPANGNQYFLTDNINDPALGTYGNSPHALCCGPAISDSDIAIEKKTKISERFNTEFRAEFFNAWNHTQFINPDGDFSDLGSTFGFVTKARDPRVIQFGLKILF